MLGGLIFLFLPPSVTGKVQLAYARIFRVPLETGRVVTLESLKAPPSKTISIEERTRLLKVQQRQANHIANLQAQLDEARGQIDALSRLSSVPEWNRMSFQLASIISDPGQAQTELLIGRGGDDGLAVGQFVLGDNSVIGTVSDVLDQTAKIKLITDPTSRIAVRVAELDVRGVMEGRRPGVAAIPQVPAKREAKVGDLVYALKTPGFPGVSIVTAEVVASRRDPEYPQLWEITVRPVCDVANLKNVAVTMTGN
jgi:rod shape-determining protein MreC